MDDKRKVSSHMPKHAHLPFWKRLGNAFGTLGIELVARNVELNKDCARAQEAGNIARKDAVQPHARASRVLFQTVGQNRARLRAFAVARARADAARHIEADVL